MLALDIVPSMYLVAAVFNPVGSVSILALCPARKTLSVTGRSWHSHSTCCNGAEFLEGIS